MSYGLGIARGGRGWRRPMWSVSRWLTGSRRRVRLHQQVHRLRQENHRLRLDNRALADRNLSVERLSAELMRFNIDLSHVSRLDAMTGLLNRVAFEACLAQEHAISAAAAASGRCRPYSVIMLDVDHFKSFNDTLGHPAGDECLVRVAAALKDTIRQGDFIGRYGGEEVIVLCPGLDRRDAYQLAERLREAVRALAIGHPRSGTADVVTVSVGLATGEGETDSVDDHAWTAVVKAADRMLYAAKEGGRDRVVAA